jgi:hypothetical protein
MIVRVDATGRATLDAPEDCRAFHVEAGGGDVSAVAAALGSRPPAAADHVWVAVDWVRQQAAGRVPEGWDGDFAKMLDFAAGKGWLDEGGHAIQAHVVWV